MTERKVRYRNTKRNNCFEATFEKMGMVRLNTQALAVRLLIVEAYHSNVSLWDLLFLFHLSFSSCLNLCKGFIYKIDCRECSLTLSSVVLYLINCIVLFLK